MNCQTESRDIAGVRSRRIFRHLGSARVTANSRAALLRTGRSLPTHTIRFPHARPRASARRPPSPPTPRLPYGTVPGGTVYGVTVTPRGAWSLYTGLDGSRAGSSAQPGQLPHRRAIPMPARDFTRCSCPSQNCFLTSADTSLTMANRKRNPVEEIYEYQPISSTRV